MTAPALVAVAHGSRDPRSAATMSALIERVRALRPGLEVRLGFLELSAPRLDAALATVERAVVVPLLLGRAYHAKIDVPAAVAAAVAANPRLDVQVAAVLGPDRRLEDTALARLRETGADPDDPATGVLLGANGSSQAAANEAVAAVARRLAGRTRWQVRPGFAAGVGTTVPAAVAALRAGGARRIAVGSWFLAPGRIPDRVAGLATAEVTDALLADPLGPDPAIAELVLDRYDAATGRAALAS